MHDGSIINAQKCYQNAFVQTRSNKKTCGDSDWKLRPMPNFVRSFKGYHSNLLPKQDLMQKRKLNIADHSAQYGAESNQCNQQWYAAAAKKKNFRHNFLPTYYGTVSDIQVVLSNFSHDFVLFPWFSFALASGLSSTPLLVSISAGLWNKHINVNQKLLKAALYNS